MGRVAELRLEKDVAGLVDLLARGKPMERMAAAETLCDLKCHQAVPALIACLDAGEPYAQYAAADSLGVLGDETAVGPLIGVVARSDYGNAVAARSLAKLGAQEAANAIAAALTGNGPADRHAMAFALADLGAGDALLGVAQDDEGGMLSRWPAAQALIALGDVRVVEVLTALPQQGSWTEIEIAHGLGALGDGRGLVRLAWAARDADFELRRACAQAMGEIGQRSSLGVILKLLGDENSVVRTAAAQAAAAVRGSYGPLASAVWTDDPLVRAGACEALGLLRDARAAQHLHRVIRGDAEASVRGIALRAFAAFPDAPQRADVMEWLAASLHAGNEEERVRALEGLARLMTPAELNAVAPGLNDPRPRVRRAAVEALARVCDTSMSHELVVALQDSSATVRASAARALADVEDATVVPALIEALDDTSDDVAAHAAMSLGRQGATTAATALWTSLTRREPVLRRAAAEALTRILASQPTELVRLLDDDDEHVQAIAAVRINDRAGDIVGRLAEISRGSGAAARAAVGALGRFRTRASVQALERVVEAKGAESRAAVDSLRAIGSPEAIRVLANIFESYTFESSYSDLHDGARAALVALGA